MYLWNPPINLVVQAGLIFHYYFTNNVLEKPPAKLSNLGSASNIKLKIVFCNSNAGSRLEEYEMRFTFE